MLTATGVLPVGAIHRAGAVPVEPTPPVTKVALAVSEETILPLASMK